MVSNIKIFEIDMSLNYTDFLTDMNSFLQSYADGQTVLTDKTISTRQGKTVKKIIFTHPTFNAQNNFFEIVFEFDVATNTIVLKPSVFSNMQGGYYNYSLEAEFGDDEDVVCTAFAAFKDLADRLQGTFYAIAPANDLIGISNGMVDHNKKLCVVAGDGTVYGAKDVTVPSDLGVISFNVVFKDWVSDKKNEDANFANLLSQCSTLNEQMDIIGKYLISKKHNGEIEASEFVDVYKQAGLFGFNDAMLQSFYRLLI